MGDFFPFFMFFMAGGRGESKRRAPQSFTVISVITGSEILLTKPAHPDQEDQRIADYRRSPLSRLLVLNT